MLRLLGTPLVVRPGGTVSGLPEKAFVLAALLAIEGGGPISRERLRTLLWEDSSAAAAAANLRWLLSAVRRWQGANGIDLLTIDRTAVGLSEGLDVDVLGLLRTGVVESSGQLDALLDMYRGDLLEGVALEPDTQLGQAIYGCRSRLRRHFTAVARDAALRVPGERGERILRDLIAQEGDDEGLLRALLLRIARERGRQAVRNEYNLAVQRLRREYDIAPSAETQSLFAQLVPAPVTPADVASPEPTAVETGIPRIVLLPPEVPLAVDPQAATIADALVEDVSLQLCRMRTFAMFAPHTARRIAGLDPIAAAAPLGVGYVARTMLLPARGSGLRLTLSLTRTATNTVVFGDQFDFEEAQLGLRFAELAESIAAHLVSAIEQVEIGAYRRTGSASAYIQYLLGMKVLDSNDLKSLRRARNHFGRALELTPGYVPAMTGVARTLSKEALALRRTDADLAARALELANRAAEIDPLDPNAYREKALASLYLHDIDGSLAYLDAARSRARHHADIIAEKADVLVHASRPLEAKQHIVEAMSLNPLPPDDYHWVLGSAEFFLGHYGKSVQALLKMSQTDSVSRLIAAAAAMEGDTRTATRYRERWMSIYPDSSIGTFAQFMPHASKADVSHYVDALRRAGFT